MSALGYRLNNPGDIERADGTPWQGMSDIQDNPTFVTFIAPIWGIRAIAKTLHTYQHRWGLKTVAEIINRWAPPSENDTRAYIDAVCKELGVTAVDEVNVDEVMPQLVTAIIRHEIGSVPYTQDVINQGINLP